jgi:uncharacterized protein YfaP (DUF2135 family)
MRKYSSNLAFVDLLFNLLVGFTSLFVIAFLLINPIAKKGIVDPPVILMVEMEWNDYSELDMDLYIQGPDGIPVYYGNKSNGYITLKRDDVGTRGDIFVINGESTTVYRNYEITTMTALPDGDYIINVHYFSAAGEGQEVRVRMTGIQPFQVYYEGSVHLTRRKEATVIVFKVRSGKITDIRNDVPVKLRVGGMAP